MFHMFTYLAQVQSDLQTCHLKQTENVASRKTPAGSTPASPANLGLGAEGYLPPRRLHLYPGWLGLLEEALASWISVVSFGFSFVGPFSTSGPSVPLFPLLGPAGPLGLYLSFLLFWCCERLRLFGKIGPGQLGA